MRKPKPATPGDLIITTMIKLARCSQSHRIILSGSAAPERMFELHRYTTLPRCRGSGKPVK